MEGFPKSRKSFLDLSNKGQLKRLKQIRLLDLSPSNVHNSENDLIEPTPGTSNNDAGYEEDSPARKNSSKFDKVSCTSVFDGNFESSDSDDESDDKLFDDTYKEFSEELRHWYVKHQIAQVALTALLFIPFILYINGYYTIPFIENPFLF